MSLGSESRRVHAQSPAPATEDPGQQPTETPEPTPSSQPPTAAPSATLPPSETPYTPSATPPAPSPTSRPADTATTAPSAVPTAASSTTATEPPNVLPNEERPLLVLDRYDVEPGQPSPGQQFRLRLHVKNEGEHFAENVRVGLSSPTFLTVNQGALRYRNNIDEGDSAAIEVDMRVISEAKSGIYSMAVTLYWDDSYGDSYSDETSIGITVGEGVASRPVLTVISTRLPARVTPGSPFELMVELLNSGGREARNAVVAPAAGPLALQGGAGGPINVPPGASAALRMRMMASETGEPGATTQQLELRYDDPDGERYTESHSVGLVITGKAAVGPLPLVSAYRTRVGDSDNAALQPGSVFELELEVLNAGLQDASGTRLSIGGGSGSAGAGVFGSVGTSNLRFLDRIGAGETTTVRQRMVVDPGASPGAYVVELSFDYVDADGVSATSTEQISLLVSREVRLALNPINLPTSGVEGMPLGLMLDLVNQGGNTVSVANATITGEGAVETFQPVTEFVGPLDAGGFFTLQAELQAAEAGEGEIVVTIEYLDDFNEPRELVQRYPVQVEAAPEMPVMDPSEMDDAPRGNVFLRAIKGFLGLGASPPRPSPGGMPMPDGMGPAMEGEMAPAVEPIR